MPNSVMDTLLDSAHQTHQQTKVGMTQLLAEMNTLIVQQSKLISSLPHNIVVPCTPPYILEAFDLFDSDGSGFIASKELQVARRDLASVRFSL